MEPHKATWSLILIIAGGLCFVGAAVMSFPPDNTWRIRLLGAGAALCVASTLF